MPSRAQRRRKTRQQCLICLGGIGGASSEVRTRQCRQCRHVCHQDCFDAWRHSRDDLDWVTTTTAPCPLCNIPKPYEDRYCPGCGVAFVRIGGCHRMRCTNCHYQFDFHDAPRQPPPYLVYSAAEIWWWRRGNRGTGNQGLLRWSVYILTGLLVGLLVNLLLLGAAADAWDRRAFSVVFGGLAATQLMVHWEGIPELGNPDTAATCYCLLLAICGGSLILKIMVRLLGAVVGAVPEFNDQYTLTS